MAKFILTTNLKQIKEAGLQYRILVDYNSNPNQTSEAIVWFTTRHPIHNGPVVFRSVPVVLKQAAKGAKQRGAINVFGPDGSIEDIELTYNVSDERLELFELALEGSGYVQIIDRVHEPARLTRTLLDLGFANTRTWADVIARYNYTTVRQIAEHGFEDLICNHGVSTAAAGKFKRRFKEVSGIEFKEIAETLK